MCVSREYSVFVPLALLQFTPSARAISMDQYTSLEPETKIKIDIDGFDRNLREILFDLQRKRLLLKECRQELNESILKQHDLDGQLRIEKHKNTNDEYHRIILRNGAEALEEDKQKCTKELIKLKVQFGLSVAERDSLRNQVRSQCLEINYLKRQVDDLSSKHRCHSVFQKDISEQLSKIKVSLNQVNDLMIPLRKKQENLENISDTNIISEQLLVSAKQFEKQKYIAEKERDEIENKLIVKSAELSKLQDLLEDSPAISTINTTFSTNLHYWKETCQDLESKLRIEKDGTELLTNALKLSHENEEYLRKELIKVENKTSDLEGLQKCHKQMIDIETQTDTKNEESVEIIDLVKSETE